MVLFGRTPFDLLGHARCDPQNAPLPHCPPQGDPAETWHLVPGLLPNRIRSASGRWAEPLRANTKGHGQKLLAKVAV